MKLREHRGGLAESMETAVEIGDSMAELESFVREKLKPHGVDVTEGMVRVEPYFGIDPRNGWHTHIVTIDGYGVFGFTDCQPRGTEVKSA